MAKMSSKQCLSARDLLKWNVHDLASRVNVAVKRIESFERGSVQLYQNENTEIADVFKKEGVEFLSDFEVKLKKEPKNKGAVGIAQTNASNFGSGGNNLTYYSDGSDNGGDGGVGEYGHADDLERNRAKSGSKPT